MRYRVKNNPRSGRSDLKFAVIDDNGEAELGNWIIAECIFEGHAQMIADALNGL